MRKLKYLCLNDTLSSCKYNFLNPNKIYNKKKSQLSGLFTGNYFTFFVKIIFNFLYN